MKKIIILALSGLLFGNGFSQESVERKFITDDQKAQITEELDLTLNRWEKAFNAKDSVARRTISLASRLIDPVGLLTLNRPFFTETE